MVDEIRGEQESEWAAMTRVAELLGVGTRATVGKWMLQGQVDGGVRPRVSAEAGRAIGVDETSSCGPPAIIRRIAGDRCYQCLPRPRGRRLGGSLTVWRTEFLARFG